MYVCVCVCVHVLLLCVCITNRMQLVPMYTQTETPAISCPPTISFEAVDQREDQRGCIPQAQLHRHIKAKARLEGAPFGRHQGILRDGCEM